MLIYYYNDIILTFKKKKIKNRTKKMKAVKKNRLKTLCSCGVSVKRMATKASTYKTLQVNKI